MSIAILSVSILLQLVAVALMLRLMKVGGRWEAWALFGFALALVGGRSSFALYHAIIDGVSQPADLPADLLGLGFSILMVAGVVLIGRLFRSLASSNAATRREALFLDALHTAKIGIIEINFRNDSVFWSDEVYRRFGYRNDEFVPTYETLFEFVHEHDRDRVRGAIESFRQISAGGPMSIDYRTSEKAEDDLYIHAIVTAVEKDMRGRAMRLRIISENITERVLADENVKKAESILTEAQRLAHIGSWEWDIETNVIDWSDELYRIFGLEPHSIKLDYDTIYEFIHPDDASAVKNVIHHSVTNLVPYDIEYRCIRPTGEVRNCHVRGKIIAGENATAIRMIGTVQDITERVQAAASLKERGEQLQLAMSVTNDGWYDWDLTTNRIYFDPRYYTMAGYEPNEFPGTYEEWRKRVHPQDIEKTEKEVNEFLDGEIQKYDVEFRFKRKDGDWMWIRARIKIISRDENDAPRRLVGTHTDISERVRADEALKSREEQLRLVVAVNNDGWYDWDLTTNLIYFDPRYYTMAGYEPNEFPGTYDDATKLIHPVDFVEMEKALARFVAGTDPTYDLEYRYKRKDGEWMWIRARNKIISRDENGKPVRVVGTTTDITDRKLAEIYSEEAQRISHLGFWELDLDSGESYWSEETYRIFRLPSDNPPPIAEEYYEKYIPQPDRDYLRESVKAHINGTSPLHLEHRIIRANGDYGYVVIQPILRRDAATKSNKLFGTILDITKSKRSELNLLKAQRMGHLGFWELDVQTNAMTWSEETYRIHGRQIDGPAPDLDEYSSRYIPESERDSIEAHRQAHINDDIPFNMEFQINRDNGEPGYVRVQAELTRNADGEPIKLFGTTLNITASKISQEKIRLNEERLRNAQRIAHLGIWDIDFSSRTFTWSDESFRILGLPIDAPTPTLDEFISRHIREAEWGVIAKKLDAHINDGIPLDLEHAVIKANGEIGYVYVRAEVVRDAAGNLTNKSSGTVLDVTERNQTQSRLIHAQSVAHLGFWELDLVSSDYWWSEETYRIFRRPMDGPPPKIENYYRDYVPESEWETLQAQVKAHLEANVPFDVQYPIIREDGELAYIRARAEIVRDASGKPIKRFGTILDITESKLLELDLKKAQRIAKLGFWEYDLKSSEFTWSEETYRIFRRSVAHPPLSMEEFQKTYIPISDRESVRAQVNGHIKAGVPYDLDHSIIREDGESGHIRVRSEIVRDISGEPTRLFGTVLDITDIKQTELNLEEAQRIAHLGSWELDLESLEMQWSKETYRVFRLSPDESPPNIETCYRKYVPEGDVDFVKERYLTAIKNDELLNIEYPIIRANGEAGYVRVRAELKRDSDGKPSSLFGTLWDITDSKRAEKTLQDSEERFRGVFDQSIFPMVLIGADGEISKVNEAFTRLLGYSVAELRATGWNGLIHPDDLGGAKARIHALLTGKIENYEVETRHIDKSGKTLWIASALSTIKDEAGTPKYFIAMLRDITKTRQLSEQLSYQASHDALTDLVNRLEFERRLQRVLATRDLDQSNHALCYMDLDQFKVVNDTYGHVAGDEMLRQLSVILRHEVRKRDTVARLGGDEFGVLMEHCSLDQAHRVVSTLQKAVQDFQFSWENRVFRVGVSIGLVAITAETQNITELLRRADAACYMAKDQGRNRIHVYHADDTDLAKRHGEMQWVTHMYQALEEDRFCLYVQPISPLGGKEKTPSHYEILVRMVDENGKHILPGAFLPAAERYNLISRLDRWVINATFEILESHPLFLQDIGFCSINLSGQSLAEADFQEYVISRLEAAAISPAKICFEITETAAITNLASATQFIAKMKAVGCRFALDDFGSGLSSFGYLKNLDVDYLKIDGMFVKNIVDDPIDYAMVKSINEIGQVMGMKTIAEFVENDEIKFMLEKIGVNYAQGYGVGKPMPINDFLENYDDVNAYRKHKATFR